MLKIIGHKKQEVEGCSAKDAKKKRKNKLRRGWPPMNTDKHGKKRRGLTT
jgi:hypothetical protein